MKRKVITIISVMAVLTVLATNAFAKEINVRGRLQRTIEAGGWLIKSQEQEFLILNSQRFQNQPWFTEAAEVEATGEIKSEVMTIYMEGTPFDVTAMRAVTQNPAGANQNEARGLTKVIVSGDAIVRAQPDTAVITIAVVNQGKRAIDAQQDNANKSDAVVRALKSAAGPGAEVKTSGYSLQPMRVYREGQPPTITGYEARNSVTVTLSDLTRVGTTIDAASQAGANDVTGLSFSLRKDQPARDQALSEATREAISKARVIALALGGRLVRVVEVQEEGTVRPRPVYEMEQMQSMRVGVAAPTPIEAGTLDVTSRVQLIAEIEGGH